MHDGADGEPPLPVHGHGAWLAGRLAGEDLVGRGLSNQGSRRGQCDDRGLGRDPRRPVARPDGRHRHEPRPEGLHHPCGRGVGDLGQERELGLLQDRPQISAELAPGHTRGGAGRRPLGPLRGWRGRGFEREEGGLGRGGVPPLQRMVLVPAVAGHRRLVAGAAAGLAVQHVLGELLRLWFLGTSRAGCRGLGWRGKGGF
mmetsp:Transcript_15504/g.54334  ORF Transcript_15504/g.54334 Transcript_15504/m.54334 type:complete len:200 (+) Transcript_15504:298-897(+)